ncbi:hypothetical protein [Flavobacterium sp. S87F.05.LMB.W.Kidney.N]|uniref:hypothetical protein n=1 Tax=Flavobacterium sp. S87F.05.LMB.W.Kidney.N TaxID=1278758 RepID=UPI0010EFFD0E|nr:hypothetical protein [Flavobacterium sp. S87F.05.LMB.W.Kidney.N]TDX13984.1 hypothetical protein EDB96_0700 [Flavobacterium sp. S87F.05.LMB.W.Kidney.N]
MESKHKITVPKPCHENWNIMTPNDNGRFCISCSKTVVDFTSMLPDEIQSFFIRNQNKNVCGRFKKSQLDSITIQIPNRVLHSQTRYHKMFLLALFITMGTTLFSCQNKDGKKQKIQNVEVVKDTTTELVTLVGEVPLDPNDSIHSHVPPPPPPKANQVKFVKPVSTECSKTTKTKVKSSNTIKEEDSQFVTGAVMQKNAEFPGGIDQFYTFFAKEFKKPEDSNITNTRLAFAVEKNGSVSYLQCSPIVEEALEKEIIRVLSLCPKWQPGESNGKKIKMQYSLPIALQ